LRSLATPAPPGGPEAGREYNVRPRLLWRHANNSRADTAELDAWVGFKPNSTVKVGVARFVEWYRNFYNVRD